MTDPGFGSQSPIISDDVENQDGEKLSRREPFAKKQCCRKTHIATLLFVLYGGMLVALLVKSYYPVPSSPNCSLLLATIRSNDILKRIFTGRWIMQEAYSSDSLDQYALTHAKSSWAEFTRMPDGTINLDMAHMLSVPPNRTMWCVHHHFTGIVQHNNTLHLNLPEFKSSATFQFLKACNECLVMTAKAYVPGYSPLNYLLLYGLYPDLHEYYIKPTRLQASCKRLVTPPPFKYYGAELCPNDVNETDSPEARGMDFKHFFVPR
ncbi:uncharacterized protein LOC132447448 [Gadus macrocephalus]|uniref:uncharacterized protein LOC132447448 n=1 Tax=Gadus macrocephalus TaxID=80720 RepID=UPI0028CB8D2F|nr:uncharacterized protein LOC132447448 [Gadus macrocephalus]XP_059894225.1 uncharacterized protein LOC132447448 [Gadus macrocephalus]